MKPIMVIFLALLACSCGRKNQNHEITAWLISTTDGVRYEILYTALSDAQFAKILERGATEPHTSLALYLSKGIAVSNVIYAIALAEQYGITNITVNLNQTRPPNKTDEDPGIMYEGQK